MRPGQSTGLWLPHGRFVTRWKEQRPSANNAVTARSPEELREVLDEKFSKEALRNIGVFEFLGWADEGQDGNGSRGLKPEPVVAFASVLSRAEIRARLEEIAEMVDHYPDGGPFWIEVFVRSRTQVEDDEAKRRFKPKRRDSKREFRRD